MSLIAITGVPGSGKSTLAKQLLKNGERVIDLHETVIKKKFILGRDASRDSLDVDIPALSEFVSELDKNQDENIFLDGHLSHLLPIDTIIILRCHPNLLKQRLEKRGWSPEKVRENLEAEAMAVITQESLDSGADSYELDVTDIKVEDIFAHVKNIIQGNSLKDYRPGRIDFFQEILEWY